LTHFKSRKHFQKSIYADKKIKLKNKEEAVIATMLQSWEGWAQA